VIIRQVDDYLFHSVQSVLAAWLSG